MQTRGPSSEQPSAASWEHSANGMQHPSAPSREQVLPSPEGNNTSPKEGPAHNDQELPPNWKAVPSFSRPGAISFLHQPTGMKQMTRPTGEPTVEELKTFQMAVYEQQSKMMSEWLQQEQHETQFGNYQAVGGSHASRSSVADEIRGRMEAIQQRMLQETSAIQTEATDGLVSTDFAHQKIARMRQFYGHQMQMLQQQAQIEAIQQQMLQETSAIQKEATDGLISTDCAHQKVGQMRQFYGHHMQMLQQQLMIHMSPYAAPQHELGREPPLGGGGTSIEKTKEGKGQRNGPGGKLDPHLKQRMVRRRTSFEADSCSNSSNLSESHGGIPRSPVGSRSSSPNSCSKCTLPNANFEATVLNALGPHGENLPIPNVPIEQARGGRACILWRLKLKFAPCPWSPATSSNGSKSTDKSPKLGFSSLLGFAKKGDAKGLAQVEPGWLGLEMNFMANGQIIITSIHPESPAAGMTLIMPGDLLISVGEQMARHMNPEHLAKLTRGNVGDSIEVTLGLQFVPGKTFIPTQILATGEIVSVARVQMGTLMHRPVAGQEEMEGSVAGIIDEARPPRALKENIQLRAADSTIVAADGGCHSRKGQTEKGQGKGGANPLNYSSTTSLRQAGFLVVKRQENEADRKRGRDKEQSALAREISTSTSCNIPSENLTEDFTDIDTMGRGMSISRYLDIDSIYISTRTGA